MIFIFADHYKKHYKVADFEKMTIYMGAVHLLLVNNIMYFSSTITKFVGHWIKCT